MATVAWQCQTRVNLLSFVRIISLILDAQTPHGWCVCVCVRSFFLSCWRLIWLLNGHTSDASMFFHFDGMKRNAVRKELIENVLAIIAPAGHAFRVYSAGIKEKSFSEMLNFLVSYREFLIAYTRRTTHSTCSRLAHGAVIMFAFHRENIQSQAAAAATHIIHAQQ